MSAQCPVCRRAVGLAYANRVVHSHRDKAGAWCPMSLRELPESMWEAA